MWTNGLSIKIGSLSEIRLTLLSRSRFLFRR